MAEARRSARDILAATGRLRAAINLGNAALASRDTETGTLGGVSPALARALADELGVGIEFATYEGAGKVFDAVDEDAWDLAFLAIDPKRAEKIGYTAPYVVIEGTYAVAHDAPDTACAALDRPGARLMVARNSAYDLYLTKHLRHAEIVRAPTPPDSFAMYRRGGYAAVAGVRQSLEAAYRDDPTIRILPDAITTIRQAIAVPLRKAEALEFLDAFIEARKADGFVRTALDTAGRTDVAVAPPGA
jgi:polar amino acid transport system substrate-binding protein